MYLCKYWRWGNTATLRSRILYSTEKNGIKDSVKEIPSNWRDIYPHEGMGIVLLTKSIITTISAKR